MTSPLTVLAPAKTNLVLTIEGRRPDGFHELHTVFQALDVFDRLTLTPRDDAEIVLTCTEPTIPTDGTNLVVRALTLLRERTGLDRGADLRLEKAIPHGAGLGGGSSDAAAALVAANDAFDLGLGLDELETLGGELGSDVAFFVRGGTQQGTGRGEILTPAGPLTVGAFLVVWPGVVLSTADVYGRGDFGLTPDPDPRRVLALGMTREDPEGVARGMWNALERPAFSLHPSLAELKGQILGHDALAAFLSGSGSAIVGYFEDRVSAEAARAAMAASHPSSFVALPSSSGVRRDPR